MNVRSKILKIRNLPVDGKKDGQIKAKPYGLILLFLCIGLALLCTQLYFIGIVVVGIFLYYLVFVKDMTLVEFYDTFAVFYLNNGKDECFLLFWEDLDHWEMVSSKKDLDVLNVVLKNNQTVSLKCLGKKKIIRNFKKHASTTKENASTEQHAL